jgi:hypothetical protein
MAEKLFGGTASSRSMNRWGDFTVQPTEHPVYRAMRITARFSFYVSQQISRDFGISGDPPSYH